LEVPLVAATVAARQATIRNYPAALELVVTPGTAARVALPRAPQVQAALAAVDASAVGVAVSVCLAKARAVLVLRPETHQAKVARAGPRPQTKMAHCTVVAAAPHQDLRWVAVLRARCASFGATVALIPQLLPAICRQAMSA